MVLVNKPQYIVTHPTSHSVRIQSRRKQSVHGEKTKGFFASAWDSVKSAASSVYDTVTGAVKSVYTAVTGGAAALNQDVRDYAGGVKEVFVHTEDKAVETVAVVANDATKLGSNLGKNAEGIAGSLALPLAIGGVAALFIFMKLK